MAKPPIFWLTFWCGVELALGALDVLMGWTLVAWAMGLLAGFLLGMLLWRKTLRDIWEDQHRREW